MAIETTVKEYRDLDLKFIPHPITGDVVVKTGDAAIIASLKNLILTNFYERPFHPEKGSGVKQMLFENADPLTAQYLKKAIYEVVENFEPRVTLRDVVVQIAPDNNKFEVILNFYIENKAEPVTIDFFLERVR
jgi:phage baseplate assembly protein W